MKQLEVQIMGQSYLLGCPDGGDAHLQDAVQRVDAAMNKIRDAGKVRARDRIAVLAALNLAFDLGEARSRQADPVNSEAVLPGTVAQRLTELLARLDDALGRDDQLI